MIRIATLRQVAPRVQYHKLSAALSAEEKAGCWLGSGPRLVGLPIGSAVATQDFEAVLKGFHPKTGIFLGQNRKLLRRAGWDVCVSTHKSVSVAALTLGKLWSRVILDAHQVAIRAVASMIDSLACRQNDGLARVQTGNALIAAFTHFRSRRDDPHLHTHLIVANATLDEHDTRGARWRSLEPAPIFRHHKLLDLVFNRELLRELKKRGLPAELDAKGRATLPVPKIICERLSMAKKAIQAATKTPGIPVLQTIHAKNRMNPHRLRDLVNDRIRPPKTMEPRSLPTLISIRERRSIIRAFSVKTAPPASGLRQEQHTVESLAKKARAWFAAHHLFPSRKAIFQSLLAVANEDFPSSDLIAAKGLLARSLAVSPAPPSTALVTEAEMARLKQIQQVRKAQAARRIKPVVPSGIDPVRLARQRQQAIARTAAQSPPRP